MTPDPKPLSDKTWKLLCMALSLSFLLAWAQWRARASTFDSYNTSVRQLKLMQEDAARIVSLRNTPQTAVGAARTSQELLHQVEKALAKAGVDRSLWSDSVPQAVVRLPGTDYQRCGVRLYFGGVNMQQLAGFAHYLHADDPTLDVTAVNLTNREQESPKFDVDVVVSYLVFAPRSEDQ